jgi:phage FluMu gp28-like protein
MGLPPVLLPYQQRWIADQSPVKVCEKSRRVGLSWAQAADSALVAAAEKGMDTWYIGYNKEMAQEFIRDAGDWARHYQLAASEMEEFVFEDEDAEKGILAYRINFASGYRVTALSSRPSNLRGKQGIVVIDEAAFHDKLDELIKAAMALLMWGGRVYIISTHDGVENPFNELVEDVRSGKVPYSLHRITLDEALADGLYKRICLTTGKKWDPQGEAEWRNSLVAFYGSAADEELFCVPKSSGGAYMSRALIESRMDATAPVLRLALPDGFEQRPDEERQAAVQEWLEANVLPLLEGLDPNLRTFYGMDFGRNGDLSVFAPIVEEQGLKRRIPFLSELRNVPFRQQEQILFWIVDRLPRFMAGAMDARGNGQYLAEYAAQRYGFTRIQQVMLSEKWYLEQMPKYKAAFEDDEISIPKDADVLADHRVIVVTKGIPRIPDTARTKGADGGQRHGDSAIACTLARFAASLDIAPIEFESTGIVREGYNLADYMGEGY